MFEVKVLKFLLIRGQNMEECCDAVSKGMAMTTILQYARGQYPVNKEDVPSMLKPYWPYRD